MKKAILLSLMLVSFVGFSQEIKQDSIYISVDVAPEYSDGGIDGFRKFIAQNYNVQEIDKDLKGLVAVTFVVETDGSLSEFRVSKDLGFGTGEEAVRVLKKSKKWKAGIKDGKPVRTKITQPIQINIQAANPPQKENTEE